MPKWVRANSTLFEYMMPDLPTKDVRKNWVPYLRRCVLSNNCWCYHVAGSQDATVNPRGSDYCEVTTQTLSRYDRNFQRMRVQNCTQRYAFEHPKKGRNACRMPCTTGRGKPCLYGLLPPAKMLSLLAVARAAGVTHIVEEGREGGISAYMYWLHGFNVTSIEYLPIYEVGKALHLLAPSIHVLNGDGHKLVPQVIDSFGPEVAARTMVFFDGEKRGTAYKNTYSLIKKRVAVAAFDDSNVNPKSAPTPPFHAFLNDLGEIWYEANTSHADFRVLDAKQAVHIALHKTLQHGVNRFIGDRTIFVPGGAWKADAQAAAQPLF